MLLCAGVLQPVTGGKGTKSDQTPFFAQHRDVHGSCTRQPEQFCHSRCGTGARGVLSIVISLFPELLPSHRGEVETPCVSCNGIPCGTGKEAH